MTTYLVGMCQTLTPIRYIREQPRGRWIGRIYRCECGQEVLREGERPGRGGDGVRVAQVETLRNVRGLLSESRSSIARRRY